VLVAQPRPPTRDGVPPPLQTIQERAHALRQLNHQMQQRAAQNGEIGVHLVGLAHAVNEQRRLRASMGSPDVVGLRKMRWVAARCG